MRTNGLTAASYTPVTDLDPRLADAVLAELKEQGVAAYVRPVESSSAAGFDRPEFRVDVLDRLYVDTAAAERIRDLLLARGADPDATSDDLAWAQIVAGFDRPHAGPVRPWPALEDVGRADTAVPLAGGQAAGGQDPDDATAASGGDEEVERRQPVDDEDRYVPPPPPPLPKLEPHKKLAWLGLIGGPLLLVSALFFAFELPTLLVMTAVAGFVGGFLTLVATMDDDVDPDDPDSGAVV